MKKIFQNQRLGFTLVELIISLSVLTLISVLGSRTYLAYTQTARDLKAANLIYEEGRFLMERIVREIRENGVDYEEYFNQANATLPDPQTLGNNYCQYNQAFFTAGLDGILGTVDDESQGQLDVAYNSAIPNIVQNDLYLINNDGDRRTYISRIERVVSSDTIGKLAMLKLVGQDFGDDGINASDSYNGESATDPDCAPDERENDGLVDTWHCDPDYPCNTTVPINGAIDCDGYGHIILNDPTSVDNSFVDISPNALNVVDLRFYISPSDDPWKAYSTNAVQIQPYVTIQMTIEANPRLVSGIDDNRIPSITLTSTATTRNYSEIKSSCI